MNENKTHTKTLLSWWAHFSRLNYLFGYTLFYFLGLSIIIHFGPSLNGRAAFLGWVGIMFLVLSSFYLKSHFDQMDVFPKRAFLTESDAELSGLVSLPLYFFLLMGLICLTTGLSVLSLLSIQLQIGRQLYFLLFPAVIIFIFYGVPSVRLVYRGWGEFAQSCLMVLFTPALAYIFQVGEITRSLAFFTFPLFFMVLAMFLALSFYRYQKESFLNRNPMLEVIGWRNGVFWHNVFLLSAYVLFSLAGLFGQPWNITWPAFLSLPVALFQMFQLHQITQGVKPDWKIFELTALATVGITVYGILMALLTR